MKVKGKSTRSRWEQDIKDSRQREEHGRNTGKTEIDGKAWLHPT
jgi:hypothetical protein